MKNTSKEPARTGWSRGKVVDDVVRVVDDAVLDACRISLTAPAPFRKQELPLEKAKRPISASLQDGGRNPPLV